MHGRHGQEYKEVPYLERGGENNGIDVTVPLTTDLLIVEQQVVDEAVVGGQLITSGAVGLECACESSW